MNPAGLVSHTENSVAMVDKCFHFFPRLPTELRLEIWRLCLPHRVWELDLDEEHVYYGVSLKEVPPDDRISPNTRLNGVPPVITRVCQESRSVAKESGRVLTADDFKDLPHDAAFTSNTTGGVVDHFWTDTKRDSAHLNWTPCFENDHARERHGSPLANLAWKSRLVVGRPSFTVGWIIDMGVDLEDERVDALEQLPSLWVIMRDFAIHAGFREAAQTGLFGLLGDAPVQIVSASDKEKASAFYDFAKSSGDTSVREESGLEKELEVGCEGAMISENLSSKLHAAIMFRLCSPNCKVYEWLKR